jgi:YD repeat-containing protein
VAIYYGTAGAFNFANVISRGGTNTPNPGSPGTVFSQQNGSSGRLIISGFGGTVPWLGGTNQSVTDIVLMNGARLSATNLSARSLTLSQGSSLTVPPSTATNATALSVNVNALSIDATSLIDASGDGFPGARQGGSSSLQGLTIGYAPGSGANSGGSYGGIGGGGGPNLSYGDFANPSDFGSGGGSSGPPNFYPGANGGGVIHIVAQSIALDGIIRANGNSAPFGGSGAGSGGAIRLDCGTIAGGGGITANGGDCLGAGGGGGGGRVALYYGAMAGFNIGGVIARGGTNTANLGGPGTIFLQQANERAASLTISGAGGSTSWLGSTNELVTDVLIKSGARLLATNLQAQSLTLSQGGTLTVPAPTVTNAIALSVNVNTLSVDATSRIDVSGGGFPGAWQGGNSSQQGLTIGYAPGSAANSGGSYGGLGGGGSPNPPYGDFANPTDFGSGGGSSGSPNSYPGGNGGGVINLTAQTMVLNGVLRADGNAAPFGGSGAGSGGSILLNVGALAGTGSITANGGDCLGAGGGGGGGRVAIHYDGAGGNRVTNVFARGGTNTSHLGGSGTVLLESSFDRNGLVLGQQVVGRFNLPQQVVPWVLAGVADQQIRLMGVNSSSGVTFSLTGPSGWVGFTNVTNQSDLVTLPYSGSYTLLAQNSGGGFTNNYTFQLQATSQTAVAPGATVTGTFAGGGQAQLITVTVTNSGPLLILLNNSGAKNVTELYAQLGSPPTRGTFGFQSTIPNSSNQQILIPNAYPGTYYILVYANQIPSPGDYTVQALSTSVILQSVAPDRVPINLPSTITIHGCGFLPSAAVQLIGTNGTSFPAASVSVDSFTQITASFASNALPAGAYSVQVSLAGGGTATLTNSFQALSSGVPHFTSDLTVPSVSWQRSPSTIYPHYANTGNGPMPAPLMVLTAQQNGIQGALLAMDASLLAQGVWTSAQQPLGFNNSAQFLASGQVPGMLQPGENLTVPVYWAGWNGPFVTHGTLHWTLGCITADDPTPIDWSSLNASMRPSSIPADAWQAIFTVFTNQTGGTWGKYVSTLDSSASYLGQLGLNVADVGTLLAFEFMQADGLCPFPVLAASVDATMPAPGLPLVFSRSFGERISQRYALGPLGRGWSHNWQYALQLAHDGTVTITGPGGSQRMFQPDRRGGYFSEPGDNATMAVATGGAHTLTEQSGLLYYYNSNGCLLYLQDPNHNRITLAYSGSVLTNVSHSSGQSIALAYTGGLIQSLSDSAGRTTTFSYDATQRLQAAHYFDGTQVSYAYADSPSGSPQAYELTQITYADGTHQALGYNSSGRLASISLDGGAELTALSYPAPGLACVADALGNTITYYFDARGLPLRIQDPYTSSIYFTYDNTFSLVGSLDQVGGAYHYTYDSSGNLAAALDPLAHKVALSYGSPYSRLDSLTDAQGNLTRYTVDSQGNTTQIIYADHTTEQWNHDAVGNTVTRTNRRGQVITFLYNANGQPTRKTYPDGRTAQCFYNSHYMLTNITDSLTGVTSLRYDTRDFLTNITYADGTGFSFIVDSAGRRSSRIANDGYALNYTYDAAGRLAALSNGVNGLLVRYAYDAAGRLAQETKGLHGVEWVNLGGGGQFQAL